MARITAAHVTNRPVRAAAPTTAALVEPVRSYSSRMRARMSTPQSVDDVDRDRLDREDDGPQGPRHWEQPRGGKRGSAPWRRWT
jgi:hypothetical protein